jgi:hypothetical protein
LHPYLFGVDNESQIPLITTKNAKMVLEDHIFRTYMASSMKANPDGSPIYQTGKTKWWWPFSVAESSLRDIYALHVKTPVDHTDELVDWLNSYDHKAKPFSTLSRNCSHLTREVFNILMGSEILGGNIKTDFGLSTPVGVTQQVVELALTHPEWETQITRLTQIAGDHPQSTKIETPFQALYGPNYIAVPLLYFPQIALASSLYFEIINRFKIGATYINYFSEESHGLFSRLAELSKHQDELRSEADLNSFGPKNHMDALVELRDLSLEQNLIKSRIAAIRDGVQGSKQFWIEQKRLYQKAILCLATSEKEIKELVEKSEFKWDTSKGLQIVFPDKTTSSLSRSHILEGDRLAAQRVLLYAVGHALRAKKTHRPTVEEFSEIMGLLKTAIN